MRLVRRIRASLSYRPVTLSNLLAASAEVKRDWAGRQRFEAIYEQEGLAGREVEALIEVVKAYDAMIAELESGGESHWVERAKREVEPLRRFIAKHQ